MRHFFNTALLCGTLLAGGCTAMESSREGKTLSMKEEYIETVKGLSEGGELAIMPTMMWEAKKKYEILWRSPERQMVSCRLWEWSYTGGAHGMSETKVMTFEKGQRLTLDRIAPAMEDKLRLEALWQQAVARHFKAESYEAYMAGKHIFKPFVTENFYLDGKGNVIFVYDPYEIDCFAAGTITISIPWKY